MNDAEIRGLVRRKLSEGSLLNQRPVIASDVVPGAPTRIIMEGGGPFAGPCAICGGRPTTVRYSTALAFHERCHAIWCEEVDIRSGRPAVAQT